MHVICGGGYVHVMCGGGYMPGTTHLSTPLWNHSVLAEPRSVTTVMKGTCVCMYVSSSSYDMIS